MDQITENAWVTDSRGEVLCVGFPIDGVDRLVGWCGEGIPVSC